MSDRGIQVVREHLAKLPPSNSLTIEQRRSQYERAERVFPTPADVTIDRVTAPTRPAERLRPPGVRTDAAVLYLHGGGYVIGSPRSHRHLAAAIARAAGVQALLLGLSAGARASVPGRARRRASPPTSGCWPRACAPESHRRGRRLRRRRPHHGHAAGPARSQAAAARGRRLHLAVGGSHVQRRQLRDARPAADPIVTRDERREDGPGLRAGAVICKAPLVSPLFADLRDLPPLLDPGRQRRGAAGRRARARAARAGGRRRRAPSRSGRR